MPSHTFGKSEMSAVKFNRNTARSDTGSTHRHAVLRVGRLKVSFGVVTNARAVYLQPELTFYRRSVKPDERTMA